MAQLLLLTNALAPSSEVLPALGLLSHQVRVCDYDVTALPRMVSTSERRNGKFVYRSDDFTGMRIGSGGPEFRFNTLNGSIRIINRGK